MQHEQKILRVQKSCFKKTYVESLHVNVQKQTVTQCLKMTTIPALMSVHLER